MQYVKLLDTAYCVYGAICIPLAVFYYFQDTCAAKAFQRLGLIVLTADLDQMQRITKSSLNFYRHLTQIFFR